MSETEAVSVWLAGLRWQDLPQDVIRQAKRCLRDFLACALGGMRSEPGGIASRVALHWNGPQESTVIGASPMVAARHAAFANATMANALDYDDTLFGHPGSTTFPAVLAAAEKWNCSGEELLLAAVAGYELSVRAIALLQPLIPRYEAMWDLGTLQAWGAAAATARLAGLDAKGITNVLGLISGTAPVPLPRKRRYPDEGRSMLKSAYGWAADAAIVATELTAEGFTGPGHGLDDNMGFWRVTPSARLGTSTFSDTLGQTWTLRQVAFKPFMACRFIHPVLQAVEEIMQKRTLSPEAIARVEISSFALLTDEHHYILRPVSGTDAQFSVPFTVAAMLYDGNLSPDSYQMHTLENQQVLELADRVHVEEDNAYESAYPDQLGARVRIVERDGTTSEAQVDDPKGSDTQPLSEEALTDKFYTLADPYLNRARSDEILSVIDGLESLPAIESLMQLLRGA